MPVNTPHKDYLTMASKWKRCRDAYAGEDAIHAAGTAYLPQLKDQDEAEYKKYVARAGFYNATYRTISGMKGMVFRIDPQVKVPDACQPYLDDITMSGVPLNSLVETVVEEALEVGRIGILVDYPTAPEGVTKADAQLMNLRPKMVLYKTESIINWRIESVNNKAVLTQVILEECVETRKDEFSTEESKQYRVLDLNANVYRQRVFIVDKEGKATQVGEDIFPKMNGKSMGFIPFTFISADDLTPEVDDPPMIDLVNVNIGHYRVTADYEHGCHFTGLPQPWVSGYKKEDPNEKFYIGSSAAWVFPGKDAKVGYLEFTGQGLKTLEGNLDRKEAQMAVLGARMLEPQHKGVEAAETLGLRRVGEESMLATAAATISRGISIALEWFCAWEGQLDLIADNNEEVAFELNRMFFPTPMTPQQLTALVGAWQSGAMSMTSLFENLQRGGVIATDKTLEAEQEDIVNNPPPLISNMGGGEDTLNGGAGDTLNGGSA